MKINRISLKFSNAFLVSDRRSVLVDCGCQSDRIFLEQSLTRLGIRPQDIAALILTHVHFDHCGCASYLQAAGVPVIASSVAAKFLQQGEQEGKSILKAGSKLPFIGRMLGEQARFPPVHADVLVESVLDLGDFGVEGEVRVSAGHTAGSVSVMLDKKQACVGDLMMGGYLGLPPAWQPNFHPLSSDNSEALSQIIAMRESGTEKFCVGHGEVLLARDVDRWIDSQLKGKKR